MTRHTETWTTQELERYLDEELGNARRAELSEALRRDPALRERLATVRRVDELLRGAFEMRHRLSVFRPFVCSIACDLHWPRLAC